MAEQPAFNEEEWSIVLRYSARVQELSLHSAEDEFSHKFLESVWFRTTPLFPNLRKLDWGCGEYTPLTLIRLLISPSLVDLRVWLSGTHENYTSVLAFLESHHTLCPNLKSLQLPNASGFKIAVSRAICRFRNLEVLECDYIDEAALTHVSRFHCLRKFTSHHSFLRPGGWERIAGYGTPGHAPFENLRVLKLTLGDLLSFIPCLKSHSQPFEEVFFRVTSFAPPEAVHELFSVLCSVTRRATLRHITLITQSRRGMTVEEAEASIYQVDFQVLSPLMTLNLHMLDINLEVPISLNDNELVGLVQGWPHLECLNLNRRGTRNSVPPPLRFTTLRGLLLVLARCPRLHELGMNLDATSIPLLPDEEASIRNTAVTSLSVGACSPIRRPAGVAHFLLKHLPSLVKIHTWFYDGKWSKVEWYIRRICGLEDSSPESSESEMRVQNHQ